MVLPTDKACLTLHEESERIQEYEHFLSQGFHDAFFEGGDSVVFQIIEACFDAGS